MMYRLVAFPIVGATLWALLGCAGSAPAPDEPARPSQPSEPAGPEAVRDSASGPMAVAELGRHRVTTDEVASFLLNRSPDLFEEIVDELVLRRLVEIEARERGVSCPEEDLDRRVEEAVEKEVASARDFLKKKHGVELEDHLAATKSSLEAYRAGLADRLRRELCSKILFERLVRYWSMTTEWVDACRIVVKEQRLAEEIRDKITDGASPPSLAMAYCLCPCRERGGRLPRIYWDSADLALAQRLFPMKAGEPSDILVEDGRYAIYVVLERQDREAVSYHILENAVIASLAEHPIDPVETRNWFQAVVRRLGGVRYPMKPFPAGKS